MSGFAAFSFVPPKGNASLVVTAVTETAGDSDISAAFLFVAVQVLSPLVFSAFGGP